MSAKNQDEFSWSNLKEEIDAKPTFLKLGEIITVVYGKPELVTEKRKGKDGSEFTSNNYIINVQLPDGATAKKSVSVPVMRDIVRVWETTGKQKIFRYIRAV